MTDEDARLAAAVRAGDFPEVHALLWTGADPETVGEDGLPVLCTAVAAHDEETVRALLRAGSRPDTTGAQGLPVLCTAVAAFAHRITEALVEAGADPDRVLPDGTTPLLREEDRDLLAAWAETETDPEALAEVLWALAENEEEHPRLEALGLRYADHPDPRVRRKATDCLWWHDRPLTAGATAALRALTQDPDDEVRFDAARILLGGEGGTPDELRAVVRDLVRDPHSPVRGAAAEALAESDDRTADATALLLAVLDSDDRIVRLIGAYGLALRDDPYTPQAYARVEELGPIYRPDHRANAFEDWRRRNEPPV
ncbi:hypothetical protein ADK61_35950 [Streptomyces sp. XY66]|uniref:HEAT repeat domain-containing protein n=1 Tax=Streptomyces sp. XY66 TaxID=1415563 RepID=UPI0006AE0365|nr:HEAT repeat domain-containing protein [Streptomyces sp. XY66]KOU69957.1 hypothetical protein ADK61_35950 [Streptomyces sp. XY66]